MSLKPVTEKEKSAMQKPFVCCKGPMPLELEAEKQYYFCSCGLSKEQPFCDGSHSGTKFSPIPFTGKNQKLSYMCMCKQSKAMPYCDGTHSHLQF